MLTNAPMLDVKKNCIRRVSLVITVLFAAVICLVVGCASHSKTSNAVIWNVRSSNLQASDLDKIQAALETMNFQSNSAPAGVSVDLVKQYGNWILITMHDSQGTGLYQYIGRQSGESWQIVAPTNDEYCTDMQQLPYSQNGQHPASYYLICP